jgi:hypothetical protein
MKRILCTAGCVAMWLTAGAMGDISYISQDRWIHVAAQAFGAPVGEEETLYANGFDPFDETLTVLSEWSPSSEVVETASGTGMQQSFLNPTSISLWGDALTQTAAGGAGGSGCTLHFEVTFEIDAPVAYTLNGAFDGIGEYSLTGPSLNLVGAYNAHNVVFAEIGTLQPGTYHFLMEGRDSGGGTIDYINEFTLDFSIIPAPASCGVLLLGLAGTRRRRRR